MTLEDIVCAPFANFHFFFVGGEQKLENNLLIERMFALIEMTC